MNYLMAQFSQRASTCFIWIALMLLSPLFFGSVFAEDALTHLKKGNLRFINNTPIETNLTQEDRKKLAAGQTPFATIVACSDSRVAPELIFDQAVGELFVVRLAGNTVDEFALASIEYGISYLKTPLLVVMGHAHCGAVQAAFDLKKSTFSPKLEALLKNIEPAVQKAIQQNPGKSNDALLNIAIKLNVQQVKQEIFNQIPVVSQLSKKGELSVKGALFELDTGEVQWD